MYVQSHNVFVEPLDIGALAEMAVFYRDVDLVLGRGSLRQMLNADGAETLIEFVSQGYVNARYSHVFTAIHTEMSGTTNERHTPVTAGVNGTMEADVVAVFRECTGKSGYGARKARAFLDAVDAISLDEDWGAQVAANFANLELVQSAIEATARHALGPDQGVEVRVTDLEWSDGASRFQMDRRWQDLERAYLQRRGERLSPAHLLSPFVGTLTDLQVASRFGADISTGQLGSVLLRLKCLELERSSSGRLNGIADFQHTVLRGKDLRTSVNSGQRNLRDVMALLDRAEKFRTWIAEQPMDASLLEQYLESVTADTWADNLPLKAFRFAGPTFAGAVLGGELGAAIGLVAGAADAFILDPLLRGWRPNHFIETELDPFVRAD